MKYIIERSLFKNIFRSVDPKIKKGDAIVSSMLNVIQEEGISIVYYGYDYQIDIDERVYSFKKESPHGHKENNIQNNFVAIFNYNQRKKLMSNEGPVICCIGEPLSTYEFSDELPLH